MNQQKIGKYISKLRKEKGLTQQELAEKLGVSDRTVGNWENGRNMPDLSLFNPLCEILDITINDLMSGEKVEKEKYQHELEKNIINTIDYSNKKRKDVLLMIILLIVGVFLVIFAHLNFLLPARLNKYVFIIGIILQLVTLWNLLIAKTKTKVIISVVITIALFLGSFILDYFMINLDNGRLPMYAYKVVKQEKNILYKTPLYYYYVVNYSEIEKGSIVRTLDTYTIFDEDKQNQSLDELLPFNNDYAGIDKIKNKAKDIHALVNNLPIYNQDVEFRFENNELTIHYEQIDYLKGKNDFYLKQMLIYDNALIYYLRNDVNNITIITANKLYQTTREEFTKAYSNYISIKDEKAFIKKVSNKMNDKDFINKTFNNIF